jgi:hypothetical protein
VILPGEARLATTYGVGLAAARHGQQPGVGIVGDAVGRPPAERGREGFAESILGARDVARAGREEGDEAAVAFAGDALGGAAGARMGRLVSIAGRAQREALT